MPFKKGQSGNPGGRPKGIKELQDLAREHSASAFERIVQLVKSPDERVALAAADQVLNRAYGKPAQTVDVTHRSALEDIPEDELEAGIAELRARLSTVDGAGSRKGTTQVH